MSGIGNWMSDMRYQIVDIRSSILHIGMRVNMTVFRRPLRSANAHWGLFGPSGGLFGVVAFLGSPVEGCHPHHLGVQRGCFRWAGRLSPLILVCRIMGM